MFPLNITKISTSCLMPQVNTTFFQHTFLNLNQAHQHYYESVNNCWENN